MKLLMTPCPRDGFKDYHDYYLAWVYEGKTYLVRVRPVFGKDNDKLHATAQYVPLGEMLEKYV